MSTTTRRKFFGGAAVLAVPLAAGEGAAGDDIAARLAALEDANAIRDLLRGWAHDVSTGKLTAPVAHLGNVRLDSEPAIDVAANGTATARVACIVETTTPIDGNETLVEMARLQGDGIVRRAERRVLHGSFVKRNGGWRLASTELRA